MSSAGRRTGRRRKRRRKREKEEEEEEQFGSDFFDSATQPQRTFEVTSIKSKACSRGEEEMGFARKLILKDQSSVGRRNVEKGSELTG